MSCSTNTLFFALITIVLVTHFSHAMRIEQPHKGMKIETSPLEREHFLDEDLPRTGGSLVCKEKIQDPLSLLKLLQLGEYRTTAALVSPNEALIATVSTTRALTLWSFVTGELIKELKVGTGDITSEPFVRSFSFSCDSTCIVTESSDHRIRVWSTQTLQQMLDVQLEPFTIALSYYTSVVACSPDFTKILSLSTDRTLRVLDAKTGNVLTRIYSDNDLQFLVAVWSGDSKAIITGTTTSSVHVWDALTGKCIISLESGTKKASRFHQRSENTGICALALSGGGRFVLAADQETIYLWEISTGKLVHSSSFNPRDQTGVFIVKAAFSPNGRTMLLLLSNSEVHLWDSVAGYSLLELVDNASSVGMSVDGTSLFIGLKNGTFRSIPFSQTMSITESKTECCID